MFEAWYPGNPEGRRAREEISVSGVVQLPGQGAGHFRPRPPRSPPAPTRRSLNQKRKESLPGVASAGRSPRASSSAGPPLCDFTRFATSPGHSRPTHPGPPLRRPQPPPLCTLSPVPGPACLRRRGASRPAARGCSRGGCRLEGWHVAASAPRSSLAPGLAERSALPAARCRSS